MLLFWKKTIHIYSWLPKLQSHRGYCKAGIQENTLESIYKSFTMGYKMVEFDVRITADGVVILHHDETVNGLEIKKSTYAQLKVLKKIDTLEQVLAWLNSQQDKSLKLNIELKSKAVWASQLEKITCD